MEAHSGHHDANQGGHPAETLGAVGRFWARVWDMDCVLELRLDDTGRLCGWFHADGERLEITGDPPDPQQGAEEGTEQEVHGLIRAFGLSEPFASFRAKPDADGLFLEVDLTGANLEPGTAPHVTFTRLSPDASSPDASSPEASGTNQV